MTFLVTFADGHSTLVASREAAEQIAAYWPQLRATIRDLDQEARDREEMIGLLREVIADHACDFCDGSFEPGSPDHLRCPATRADMLLKRLGRLP